MRTILLGQIHKLHFVVESEDKLFWWKPWANGHIMREPFWQDYSNYYWQLSVGWLKWSIDMHWQKTRWGWQQTSREQRSPFIWVLWR